MKCNFCSPFFSFLISPTGRNSRQIRTFSSSNDVFCSVHVPFRSLEPSNSLFRGLRPKNHQNFNPFWTSPICSGNRLGIRALGSKLPLIQRQDNPSKGSFLSGSYKPGVPSLYWRFNRKCIFRDGCRRHLEFRKCVAISLPNGKK